MSAQRPFKRLLLTNDDGIEAPGLRTLQRVAEELAEEIWVVAPDHDQSGVSHSISLHSPLRVSKKDERRFSVSGTPGDCVVMATRFLMGDVAPDMVLSGINRGANLGVETVFSGTVGAAMTGMLLGIPSIALSQAFSDRDAVRWETAEKLAADVIRKFSDLGWSKDACLNINFPDVEAAQAGPVELTQQGAGFLNDVHVVSGLDPRNHEFHWLSLQRSTGNDVVGAEAYALKNGNISVTPLQFERTNESTLHKLRAASKA
ncbi:5'/3'-nucleotidase SurE [Rhizobium leguminosarum]|uniref:5'/3'-nucleotidase SurE n=1 Tax=Rhizobium leguminosarum TaxID=384 RepID=UPI001C969CF5|nr:5'/3'-nucleotidase SurE [Rhizobium leguminosarum]MBY5406769.1 5'/3'-nucleotidase SurE [Rhizobium leguminosarum]